MFAAAFSICVLPMRKAESQGFVEWSGSFTVDNKVVWGINIRVAMYIPPPKTVAYACSLENIAYLHANLSLFELSKLL